MDLDLAHGRAQSVLRQRNILAGVSAALFALLLFASTKAVSRDREVILVPTMHSDMLLSSNGVSHDYLEMVTRDVSAIALNRSPESLTYWMNSILALTDERARATVKAALIKVVAEQQGTQIAQYFTPDAMTIDPANLTSQVGGIVHTVVASKEVTSEHRTFKFTWAYNGVSLRLMGFGVVQKADDKK